MFVLVIIFTGYTLRLVPAPMQTAVIILRVVVLGFVVHMVCTALYLEFGFPSFFLSGHIIFPETFLSSCVCVILCKHFKFFSPEILMTAFIQISDYSLSISGDSGRTSCFRKMWTVNKLRLLETTLCYYTETIKCDISADIKTSAFGARKPFCCDPEPHLPSP